MRTAVELASGHGLAVREVICRDDHRDWSQPEIRDGHNLVLVRRGRFRRRADGVGADIDPTVAYVAGPGQEEQFAHPGGGDVCTWISLQPALWDGLAIELPRRQCSTFYVDAPLDLAHRRLLSAGAVQDVDFGLAQGMLDLLACVLKQLTAGPTPADVRDHSADRLIVAAAREAILSGHPAAGALLPLAALLDVSPFRLSRAFSREMGVSLTRYRNRVRVAWALDRIERGETNLAVIAADLGFADHAHLSRTVRQHLGRTPTALRDELQTAIYTSKWSATSL